MKCIYCNAELNENSSRCEYCGNEQEKNNEENNNIVNNNTIPVINNNQQAKYSIFQIIILTLLIVSIIMSIVACFLPYFNVYGFTQNYVSYEGEAADGVFVIFFGALSLLFIALNKRIPVLIFQILSATVFFYDYINQRTHEVYKYASRYYGVGFKMLFVFSILSVILALVRVIVKNKPM